MFKKSLRGKGKHCLIMKNLASSYSTHCNLSVQGCAQKTLKKGRTLLNKGFQIQPIVLPSSFKIRKYVVMKFISRAHITQPEFFL